jgi:hypothetical protein
MGTVGVTMLHPWGLGDLELPLALEVASHSSVESLGVVCEDGDPVFTIPTKMVLESHSLGERLRRSRRSAVISRRPK